MTAALTASPPDSDESDPIGDRDLVHLRRLLFTEDRRDVAAIRAELFRLDKRLGTDERFRRALADHLVAALKVAEVENHRGLAGVMAPLVVSGIQREIVESRDVMVEALYPITGRLVAAAVSAAMKQLSEDINRKLEASLSPRQVQLRVKAMITRRPLSDLVLADAARGRLQRLILIDRASGAVLAATDADGKGEPEPDSTLSLLGGLVSAIVQFAGHALIETQGELRQLDFGGQMVLLRASPLFILAAITAAGAPNARLPAAVDDAFLDFLERLQNDQSQGEAAALAALHESVAEKSMPAAKKPALSPLKVMAGLLAALLGYGAWHAWRSAHQIHEDGIALAAIEQLPAFGGYPLDLSFDRDTKTILARGILPTQAEANLLRDRIATAFPSWRFAPRVAIVSETPFAHATDAALRDQATRAADLEKSLSTAVATLADLRAQIGSTARLVDTKAQALANGQTRQVAHTVELETSLAMTTKALDDVRAEVNKNRQLAKRNLDAITTTQDTTTAHTAALEAAVAGANKALADLRLEMVENTRHTVDQLIARVDTPLNRLEASTRQTAVFFDAGAAYHEPAKAAHDLGLLAKALQAAPDARLRVVGYSDGNGTVKGNLDAARKRVEHVVADLSQLGIDAHRLRVVTTRSPEPIADEPTSAANRRVVFELAYTSE